MDVHWLTVFLDRTADRVGEARAFWCAVTASTLSASRGERGQFATFVPPVGDAFLRVQEVLDGSGGSHLDLHVDDPRGGADEAVAAGATEIADLAGAVVVLTSPGGFRFCCVTHRGEKLRPPPVGAVGARAVVDQLCIDVAHDRFDRELDFWSTLTGWEARRSATHTEFASLVRPAGIPIRILLQRCGHDADGRDARGHLDLACDDRRATAHAHSALGATQVAAHDAWIVMRDPSGAEYCLTHRDPDTGLSPV